MVAPETGEAPAVLDAYAVRLGGCLVLLTSPQACLDVLRALQAAIAAGDRAGLRPPPRVVGLIRTLEAELSDHEAATSGRGSAALPRDPAMPASVLPHDPADAKEAAQMLGVTPRQVRNLGDQLDGRKIGGAWVFDRVTVAAEADRRQRERTS